MVLGVGDRKRSRRRSTAHAVPDDTEPSNGRKDRKESGGQGQELLHYVGRREMCVWKDYGAFEQS